MGSLLSSLLAPLPLSPLHQQSPRPGLRKEHPPPHSVEPPQSHSLPWAGPSMLVAVRSSLAPPLLLSPLPAGSTTSQSIGSSAHRRALPDFSPGPPSSPGTSPSPMFSTSSCSNNENAPGSRIKPQTLVPTAAREFPSFSPLLFSGAASPKRNPHFSQVQLLPWTCLSACWPSVPCQPPSTPALSSQGLFSVLSPASW